MGVGGGGGHLLFLSLDAFFVVLIVVQFLIN